MNCVAYLLAIGIVLVLFSPQTGNNVCLKLAIALFLTWILLTQAEFFHFEVTPWKKTCSNTPSLRCDKCCPVWANGGSLDFQYTWDAERMNASRTCSERQPGMKNREASYSELGQIPYTKKDNFYNPEFGGSVRDNTKEYFVLPTQCVTAKDGSVTCNTNIH
jgi:hypothetical protein